MARDALGGEGAATVDVNLIQTSMAGAALRNYTRWAFDVAFALQKPEQALQVAVAGGPRAAETIDAKHTTQLVDAITAVVGKLDAEQALVEAAAVASGVATPEATAAASTRACSASSFPTTAVIASTSCVVCLASMVSAARGPPATATWSACSGF